jgi:hypothetical protein
VDAKKIAWLLGQLPKDERNEAGRMIQQAEGWGWTHIDLWDWGFPLHMEDLVGVNTNKNVFDFLPDVEDDEKQAQ